MAGAPDKDDTITESVFAYFTRLYYFINVTSPFSLLVSDEEVKRAQIALEQKKTGGSSCSDEQLIEYQKIVDAAVHPVTSEIIPKLFRVSAIAPFNVPLVFCMLQCPPSNVAGTLFLHWVNQSYNTACNYANRSGADMPLQTIASAYALAVGSACGFAYGLGRAYQFAPPAIRQFGIVIPCLATVAANVSNLGFTRMSELTDGTPVIDGTGQVRGLSKIAGVAGVSQTAVTRCMLVPCACLLLPSLVMGAMRKRNMLPASASAVMAVELGIIYGSLQVAMPAALAIFPQTSTYKVEQLEPRFQGLTDSTGRPVSYMTSNKGL